MALFHQDHTYHKTLRQAYSETWNKNVGEGFVLKWRGASVSDRVGSDGTWTITTAKMNSWVSWDAQLWLIGTIVFCYFKPLSLTFTLAGNHKVSIKQNHLASFSSTLFSWSGWNWFGVEAMRLNTLLLLFLIHVSNIRVYVMSRSCHACTTGTIDDSFYTTFTDLDLGWGP